MRWFTLILVVVLVGCGYRTAATPPFAAAQGVLDGIAANHPNLQRLTLHAVPADKSDSVQIASTVAERRGTPSDPEDLEALSTGKEVILDEPGALDVTVPILMTDGKPTAVVGVTLKMKEGADRDALVKEAHAIAEEFAKAIQAAAKPLW